MSYVQQVFSLMAQATMCPLEMTLNRPHKQTNNTYKETFEEKLTQINNTSHSLKQKIKLSYVVVVTV